MNKDEAVEIHEYMGDIDNAIARLQELRAQGQNVYVNFNGHRLYSADASEEVVYQEMFGVSTREEYEIKREALFEEYKREEEQKKEENKVKTKENLPNWIKALKEIDVDNLDERRFFEEILKVVNSMGEIEFTQETLPEIQSTLKELGCVRFDEWKRQLADGERAEILQHRYLNDEIESGSLSFPAKMIHRLLSPNLSDVNTITWFDKEITEWLKVSEQLSLYKQEIPYYKVAKNALMNLNGLTEEQALEEIASKSFEEIDGQVYAKGSMDHAISGIVKSYKKFSGKEMGTWKKEELEAFVYEGGYSDIIDDWKKIVATSNSRNGVEGIFNSQVFTNDFNNLIMDTLFEVHDGWVEDNSKKFNAREKKHQHMPSELIGWKEAKSDLLFVAPIFESAGVKIDEEQLEEVYMDRVKEFFLDNGLRNADDLAELIAKGPEFYSALEGYGEILNDIQNSQVIREKIIPQIEENGIGKVEDVRKQIIERIIANPNPDDLARLSDEERAEVEQALGKEVSQLEQERNQLQAKNDIIERIGALAKRRSKLKEEISKEEQKRDDNIARLDFSEIK